jgi:ribosomal protein L11 methyltransferase
MSEPPIPARYPYVHVAVSQADAELASYELWELGANGIEERDASTMNTPDAGEALTLVASFLEERDAHAAAEAVSARWAARVCFVEGNGWREAYKVYFKATRIGSRLVVRPPWEAYAAAEGDVVLTLDPGMAFGTGTHETTRLVLEALESHVRAGMRVLDVGCGSGILAIASLLLGAGSALAIDVDPEAVRVAAENAEINGVAERCRVERASSAVAGEPIAHGERYPLVLANIETRVLVPAASALMACVEPGGVLILSGILGPERDRVLAAYDALQPLAIRQMGDWVALVLRGPGSGGGDERS